MERAELVVLTKMDSDMCDKGCVSPTVKIWTNSKSHRQLSVKESYVPLVHVLHLHVILLQLTAFLSLVADQQHRV